MREFQRGNVRVFLEAEAMQKNIEKYKIALSMLAEEDANDIIFELLAYSVRDFNPSGIGNGNAVRRSKGDLLSEPVDDQGNTFLHYAVHKNNAELVRWLVVSGARTDIASGYGVLAHELTHNPRIRSLLDAPEQERNLCK